MLEIAKYVSEVESERYTQEAIMILKAIDKNCCNYDENEDALVFMGTEKYLHEGTNTKGLHIPIIYGDFFFVEALLKLRENKFFIW